MDSKWTNLSYKNKILWSLARIVLMIYYFYSIFTPNITQSEFDFIF
jgi:hypothetical protein